MESLSLVLVDRWFPLSKKNQHLIVVKMIIIKKKKKRFYSRNFAIGEKKPQYSTRLSSEYKKKWEFPAKEKMEGR